MDYLPKALENGVVDSPRSLTLVQVAMNLPFPLQGRTTVKFSKSKWWENNGAQHNFYLENSPPPLLNYRLYMVQLL